MSTPADAITTLLKKANPNLSGVAANLPGPTGAAATHPGASARPATPVGSSLGQPTDPVGNRGWNGPDLGDPGAPRFDPVPPSPAGVPSGYPSTDASLALPKNQLRLVPPSTPTAAPTPVAPAAATPARPTLYGGQDAPLQDAPNLEGVDQGLAKLRLERASIGGRALPTPPSPLLPTNTVNGAPVQPAGLAPAADAGVGAGVTADAAAAAAPQAGLLARGLSALRGVGSFVGSRVLPYTMAAQTARTLVDPRMIQAGSDGTGGSRDVAQAAAGSALGAVVGQSPAELRTNFIRSDATDAAASKIVASDPALSAQKNAGSFWGDLGDAMAGGGPPHSDQQYLSPAQLATAQNAGSAAATQERARQNIALGRSDDTAYGSGGVASNITGALNTLNPARDSAPAPAAPVGPLTNASASLPPMPKGPQAEALAANINAALEKIGLGSSAAASQKPASGGTFTGGIHGGAGTIGSDGSITYADGTKGGAPDARGALSVVPDAAFSTGAAQAQAAREAQANGVENPRAAFGVGGGLPQKQFGFGNQGSDAVSEYQNLIKTTLGGLGPLNSRGKRQLAGELIGALGTNVNVGVDAGSKAAALAQQQAEFPITSGIQREGIEAGRYGLQPQLGADNKTYIMLNGTMHQINTETGQPFVGMSQKDADKATEDKASLAEKDRQDAVKYAIAAGIPLAQATAEIAASHGANSVGAGVGPRPSRAAFIKAARAANPDATDDDLGSFYDKKYGGN